MWWYCIVAEGMDSGVKGTRVWNSDLTTVFTWLYLTILGFGFLNFEPISCIMFVLNDIRPKQHLVECLVQKVFNTFYYYYYYD